MQQAARWLIEKTGGPRTDSCGIAHTHLVNTRCLEARTVFFQASMLQAELDDFLLCYGGTVYAKGVRKAQNQRPYGNLELCGQSV